MLCPHEYNRIIKNYDDDSGHLVEERMFGDCVKKQCPYWLNDIKACGYCLDEDEISARRAKLVDDEGEEWKK